MPIGESDVRLAYRLAEEAGALLLAAQRSDDLNGKMLGEHGDEIANNFILKALRDLRPEDGLLSEEEKDNEARLSQKRVWVIDPLDGSREYGEGRTDWAVHVALAIDGVATVGAVALPGLGITLSSGKPLPPSALNAPPKMLVSRTRPAKEALAVAHQLAAELVPMGSAGAKAMAVVRGEADVYLHTGGQYEWDNCAPVAVAQAAGLHCSRIDGTPLRYNNADTYLPDLLICRAELAERVLAMVAKG